MVGGTPFTLPCVDRRNDSVTRRCTTFKHAFFFSEIIQLPIQVERSGLKWQIKQTMHMDTTMVLVLSLSRDKQEIASRQHKYSCNTA